MSMTALWIALILLFLVIELITVGMVSLWFMVGAVTGLISCLLGAPLWLQTLLFLAVSGLCFALLYPRLRHLVSRNRQATNADMVLGQTCSVVRRIDNVAGTGAVSVGGKTWSARSADGEVIEQGALVRAERIQGVKLIVSPLPAAEKVGSI